MRVMHQSILPTASVFIILAVWGFSSHTFGEESGEDSTSGSRHVLIVVGLPGDKLREERFDSVTKTWVECLTNGMGVESVDVTILGGNAHGDGTPAKQQRIRQVAERLCQQLDEHDSLWVFLLGHGSEDQRHGWFHLPGPDLHDSDWGGLFAELRAGEQVFWLTYSASGRFVKAFSLPGRVVIAATDDGQINETRFPQALADVMKAQIDDAAARPIESAERIAETGQSTPATLLELFRDTADHVRRYYDDQGLVPTEHPRLDDNGDGNASEPDQLADVTSLSTDINPAAATIDGFLAGRIRLNETSPPNDNASSEPNRQ